MAGALQVELVDYGMNSVSQGIDAMAITRVVIRPVLSCSGVTPQVATLVIIPVYACCVSSKPTSPAWRRLFIGIVHACCLSSQLPAAASRCCESALL